MGAFSSAAVATAPIGFQQRLLEQRRVCHFFFSSAATLKNFKELTVADGPLKKFEFKKGGENYWQEAALFSSSCPFS